MLDVTDDELPATLEQAAREEQEFLWNDLDQAIGMAVNGEWSMHCDTLAWRIVGFAKLVGATPWGDVPMTLVRSGVYERVLSDAGVSYEPIDWDDLARHEAMIANGLR
jgi:hypothetical protein